MESLVLVKLKTGQYINPHHVEQFLCKFRHSDGLENLTIIMSSGNKIELTLTQDEVANIKTSIEVAIQKV